MACAVDAKLNSGDRVLGEVEENSFISGISIITNNDEMNGMNFSVYPSRLPGGEMTRYAFNGSKKKWTE